MAAFSALLRRGGAHHDLTVADEFSAPKLQADISIIGGAGTAQPRLMRETIGTPVTMPLPLKFRFTTQATLQAEMDALDLFLRGGECTLEVSFTDAAAATIWTVYHAQPLQPPFTRFVNYAHEVGASLQLVVSPFVTTPEVTLYNAEAFTAPDSLDLAAMTGNYRAPLTIDVNATNADLHALYLAIDATSYGAYQFNAKDLTWGAGHTDTADADAFSGTSVFIASTSFVTASIDTAALPAGPYLLLARVKVLDTHTGTITTDYSDPVTFTRASWHIVELGRCHLPTRVVRGGASAGLTVSLKSSSATAGDEACIDWLYALPIGDGFFSWHPVADATECASLGRDAATATTYVDDVANEEHVCGSTLMALGGSLLVVSENATGDAPTHASTITVQYSPRWAWMR